MKRFILVLFLLGCESTPAQKTLKSSNPNITVELLFEADGCKVYRFEGDHYFARCKDQVTTSTVQDCGEDCTRVEEVPTVRITK